MNAQQTYINPIDDGGPVHPTTTEHGFNFGMPGITKREYFAGLAMQAAIVRGYDMNNQSVAELSCCMADAMLVALKAGAASESLHA